MMHFNSKNPLLNQSSVCRHARQRQGGFTLIELIIVIAVFAGVMSLAVNTFNQISSTQIRVGSNRIAQALRYSFEYAVTHGKYVRLVISIDAGTISAESTDDPIFLSMEKREVGIDPQELTEKQKEDIEKAKEEGRPPPKMIRFSKDQVIPTIELDKDVQIKGVFTANQTDIFTSGKAYIHYFPNGFAEPALVYVGGKNSELVYTLMLSPLTGKVSRRFGEIEPDRLFGKPSKEEEED
jgi:general secretion pathway protein H